MNEPREDAEGRQMALDQVERDIALYMEFDQAEKARFDRQSYLWTAEDRIEWQETQSANAQYIRELLAERDALRAGLGLVPTQRE